MKRINYNISEQKKIDISKTVIPMISMTIISILLLIFGIENINSTNNRLSDKIAKRNFYRNESQKIKKRMREIDEKIKQIRSKWDPKVKFVNASIKIRSRSNPIKILNFIEEILPKSVYISEISITDSASGYINMSVISGSTGQLYGFYRDLVSYDLIILNENESDNLYKARLRIKYKNEQN